VERGLEPGLLRAAIVHGTHLHILLRRVNRGAALNARGFIEGVVQGAGLGLEGVPGSISTIHGLLVEEAHGSDGNEDSDTNGSKATSGDSSAVDEDGVHRGNNNIELSLKRARLAVPLESSRSRITALTSVALVIDSEGDSVLLAKRVVLGVEGEGLKSFVDLDELAFEGNTLLLVERLNVAEAESSGINGEARAILRLEGNVDEGIAVSNVLVGGSETRAEGSALVDVHIHVGHSLSGSNVVENEGGSLIEGNDVNVDVELVTSGDAIVEGKLETLVTKTLTEGVDGARDKDDVITIRSDASLEVRGSLALLGLDEGLKDETTSGDRTAVNGALGSAGIIEAVLKGTLSILAGLEDNTE